MSMAVALTARKRHDLEPAPYAVAPTHAIHRETTSQDSDLEAFVIRVGGEPEHVNVDGPESA
jgi:hypothetical protein